MSPTSFQRTTAIYSDAYSTYQGNPDLECQTSWSAELGLEHDWMENHTAGMTFFWMRTDDAIQTNYLTNPVTFYNATGHNTSQGVELYLNGTWEENWNTGYSISLTLCEPLNSDGQQLGYTARQTWAAEIHTSPFEDFTTGLGLAAASGRSNYLGGSPSMLDAYYTLRWYAQYKVNENLTLHLRVENLTNQKYVSETGYPYYADSYINAGTAIYGGCTVTF
jgi:outer membrane cobalamin receptor